VSTKPYIYTLIVIILSSIFLTGCQRTLKKSKTFCNPINIDYSFMDDNPGRREAADPVVVLHHNDYYLFASKSGGYWYSPDLLNWTLVQATGLPLDDYAPAAIVLNDKLYFTAFNTGAIYTTSNPKAGNWTKIADTDNYADPALFLDDDGRLYMYSGCSNNGPITVVKLDPQNNFSPMGQQKVCLRPDYLNRGWEVFGDENLGAELNDQLLLAPWVEGAWMTKHNSVYYLQYAAPDTQFKTYADGLYTSESPTGPFTYAPYSPFSYKPTGFITGAGHGNTFQDKQGHYWRAVTMVISVHHMFERRIGLFPAGFDADGNMFTNTYLGDYPQYLAGVKEHPEIDNLTGWMLLSYQKPARASSTLESHPIKNAFDEEIRTWWSAESGSADEWLSVELENPATVYAIQVNFADEDAKAFGREQKHYYQYIIYSSLDGDKWDVLVDKSANRQDTVHDYIPLKKPVNTRFLKIVNNHSPAEGRFAISGFQIFGLGNIPVPSPVDSFTLNRNANDRRRITINWNNSENAIGYIIRSGITKDKLYHNYQIYGQTQIEINSLNANVPYYFTINSFNESGITKGTQILLVE